MHFKVVKRVYALIHLNRQSSKPNGPDIWAECTIIINNNYKYTLFTTQGNHSAHMKIKDPKISSNIKMIFGADSIQCNYN